MHCQRDTTYFDTNASFALADFVHLVSSELIIHTIKRKHIISNCTIEMRMSILEFRINDEMTMNLEVFRCKNSPTVKKYFILIQFTLMQILLITTI